MSRFEKILVNRENKGQKNIEKISAHINELKMDHIEDALEIGCGIGTVSSWLADSYNLKVIGTDFDPEQIEAAKKMYSSHQQLLFKVEDGAALSFDNGSFDLVISENVFHHIRNWQSAVGEIARVLRPGGYFIWYDLVFPEWLRGVFRRFLKNYGFYTIVDVRSEFIQKGFEFISERKLLHGPFVHYDILLHHVEG